MMLEQWSEENGSAMISEWEGSYKIGQPTKGE